MNLSPRMYSKADIIAMGNRQATQRRGNLAVAYTCGRMARRGAVHSSVRRTGEPALCMVESALAGPSQVPCPVALCVDEARWAQVPSTTASWRVRGFQLPVPGSAVHVFAGTPAVETLDDEGATDAVVHVAAAIVATGGRSLADAVALARPRPSTSSAVATGVKRYVGQLLASSPWEGPWGRWSVHTGVPAWRRIAWLSKSPRDLAALRTRVDRRIQVVCVDGAAPEVRFFPGTPWHPRLGAVDARYGGVTLLCGRRAVVPLPRAGKGTTWRVYSDQGRFHVGGGRVDVHGHAARPYPLVRWKQYNLLDLSGAVAELAGRMHVDASPAPWRVVLHVTPASLALVNLETQLFLLVMQYHPLTAHGTVLHLKYPWLDIEFAVTGPASLRAKVEQQLQNGHASFDAMGHGDAAQHALPRSFCLAAQQRLRTLCGRPLNV